VSKGIIEGRKTFSNTLKYIQFTISANFSNMLTFALASFILPFIRPQFSFPLLPTQILLVNLLTDISMMNIALDNVDPEQMGSPLRWDLNFIKKFMVYFAVIGTAFDWVTFAVLLNIPGITEVQFHTGWFIESLLMNTFVFFMLRTRRPVWKTKPSNPVILILVIVSIVGVLITILPGTSDIFGFTSLNYWIYFAIVAIELVMCFTTEFAKHFFYRSLREKKPAPLLACDASEVGAE
jgi:Mg2+-importing ATPase